MKVYYNNENKIRLSSNLIDVLLRNKISKGAINSNIGFLQHTIDSVITKNLVFQELKKINQRIQIIFFLHLKQRR